MTDKYFLHLYLCSMEIEIGPWMIFIYLKKYKKIKV